MGNFVYRRKGSDPCDPKFTCPAVKQPARIMVWGSFGYHGLGDLVILPRNQTMNSRRYKALLKNNLKTSFRKAKIPVRKAIFQQDGATCHTAKIVGKYLDDEKIKYIDMWPGNSPDLNPIENLWAEMKYQLKGRDTSNLTKLEAEMAAMYGRTSTGRLPQGFGR